MQNGKTIQPMPIWMSAGFFAGMSLFIAVGIHIVSPRGVTQNIPVFYTYRGTLLFASVLGIMLSLVMFRREKRKGNLKDISFKERFWIHRITTQQIIWGVVLFLFWAVTLMTIKGVFLTHIRLPDYLRSDVGTIYGIPVKENYGLIVFEILFLFINILGEELFWRGYMLPRQVQQHGEKAWIVNGALWSLFHLPVYWIAPALAPGCFALAYVTQKRRSLWPATIAHILLNGTDTLLSFII